MKRLFYSCILYLSCLNLFAGNNILSVTISDAAKARAFDEKYRLVIPAIDLRDVMGLSIDTSFHKETDSAFIFITDTYNQPASTIISREHEEKEAFPVWMMPLSNDSSGFLYKSNNKLIAYKYASGIQREYVVGKDFPDFDMHCVIREGDSLFYYAVPKEIRKTILGRDTDVVDFEFYTWMPDKKISRFLFSASGIIPDSLLSPNLFHAGRQYHGMDIYHWNWMQKTGPNTLLLNFAYAGLFEVDLRNSSILWYWGQKGHSFDKISGGKDQSAPLYTHCLNKITTGPYQGCYSYFENGGSLSGIDAQYENDSAELKSPGARIFRIDPQKNKLKIEKQITYDVHSAKANNLPSMALGSVQVLEDYMLVNTGMTIPLRKMMKIGETYGRDSALAYWKNWEHYNVILYDLKGREIAKYAFKPGYYAYSAWIVPKKSIPPAKTFISEQDGKTRPAKKEVMP